MTFRYAHFLLVVACLAGGSATAGTVDDNKALVLKFIAAENSRDFENLPTYVTEGFQRHSEATPNAAVANREQFIARMRDGLEVFPDARIHVQQVVAEGDRIAVWASYRDGATGTAVDPTIDVDIVMMYRVEGDRIAELWAMWDNNALRSQLEARSRK